MSAPEIRLVVGFLTLGMGVWWTQAEVRQLRESPERSFLEAFADLALGRMLALPSALLVVFFGLGLIWSFFSSDAA